MPVVNEPMPVVNLKTFPEMKPLAGTLSMSNIEGRPVVLIGTTEHAQSQVIALNLRTALEFRAALDEAIAYAGQHVYAGQQPPETPL